MKLGNSRLSRGSDPARHTVQVLHDTSTRLQDLGWAMTDIQPDPDHTTRFVFTRSRVCILWREPGQFIVAREQEVDAILRRPPDVPSWTNFNPDNATSMGAVEEVVAGDWAHPTWWVLYGQAAPSTNITVHVDEEDVPDPIVERVGGIWACEWVSLPTFAHVQRSDSDRSARIRFDRPMFLPPAPHSEVEIGNRKEG